jgi:hypothetical protein
MLMNHLLEKWKWMEEIEETEHKVPDTDEKPADISYTIQGRFKDHRQQALQRMEA